MTTLGFAILAYLLGSIPFAVVASRLFGLADPRSYGSGNPGATNVMRSGNKPAALLTLLGDAAKGWLAVFLVQQFGPVYGAQPQDAAIAGFAAFLASTSAPGTYWMSVVAPATRSRRVLAPRNAE